MHTALRLVLACSLVLVVSPAFADDEASPLPPLPTAPAPAQDASMQVRVSPPAPATVPAPTPPAAPIVDPLAEEPAAKEPPRDPARKGMIIAAPIVYGLAASVAGISYLEQNDNCHSNSSSRPCINARNWLIAYTGISAIVPSTPRMVVGDWSGALLYSAARGGSIITAAAVDWGKENWQGPFALGFALPVALACVDLATTPHRAKGAEEPQQAARITSVAPVAVSDASGKANGAAISMGGTF